jgi:4a-hydroxytetrahydrobiopterin dehydratase
MTAENLDDLLNGHCVEYPKGTPTLDGDVVRRLLPLVPGWELVRADERAVSRARPPTGADGQGLRWTKRMDDFMAAVEAVNKVAALAEEEQHHPDIRIHGYRNLALDLSTHSIGGLSLNDFIMAAKINRALG